MTMASKLGLRAVIAAAAEGSMLRVIQLSRRTLPLGSSSTFLEAKRSRCNGVTIDMPLQETARVRIFSLNTKNGIGKLIS